MAATAATLSVNSFELKANQFLDFRTYSIFIIPKFKVSVGMLNDTCNHIRNLRISWTSNQFVISNFVIPLNFKLILKALTNSLAQNLLRFLGFYDFSAEQNSCSFT